MRTRKVGFVEDSLLEESGFELAVTRTRFAALYPRMPAQHLPWRPAGALPSCSLHSALISESFAAGIKSETIAITQTEFGRLRHNRNLPWRNPFNQAPPAISRSIASASRTPSRSRP